MWRNLVIPARAGPDIRLTVPVRVLDVDEIDRRLLEIDENLVRAELSALERAEHFEERKRLYEARSPEAHRPRGGRPRKNSETVSPFFRGRPPCGLWAPGFRAS